MHEMSTPCMRDVEWQSGWRSAVALVIAVLLSGCSALQPATPAVIVEWTTETEVNVAGFNLYRGESPDGPFERINDRLIPGSPDPLLGGHYVYTDTEVEAGKTYFYKLEDVELDGTSTFHGPIEVRAKGGDWLDTLSGPLVAVILAGVGGALLVARWSRRPR